MVRVRTRELDMRARVCAELPFGQWSEGEKQQRDSKQIDRGPPACGCKSARVPIDDHDP